MGMSQRGDTLRAWRVRKGLSQQDLADKLGISQSFVCKFETSDDEFGELVALKLERFSEGEIRAEDCVADSKRGQLAQFPLLHHVGKLLDGEQADIPWAALITPPQDKPGARPCI